MTSPLYGQIRTIATDVLNTYGQTLVATRTDSTGATSSVNLKGIQIDKITHVMPGSRIDIGDWAMLFTASPAPLYGDRISLNDGSHVLMEVEEIAPAGVVVAYYAWARRG